MTPGPPRRSYAEADDLLIAMYWAYNPVVWVIEALVLDRFLPVGFWKCLGMTTVANLVSPAISALWYFGGDGMRDGWKTAWIFGHKEVVVMLFIRSFTVTVAEEPLVVLLLMRKRVSAQEGLKAVTAAHAVTYGLTALLVAYLLTNIKARPLRAEFGREPSPPGTTPPWRCLRREAGRGGGPSRRGCEG